MYYFCSKLIQGFYQDGKMNFFKDFFSIWWDDFVISDVEFDFFLQMAPKYAYTRRGNRNNLQIKQATSKPKFSVLLSENEWIQHQGNPGAFENRRLHALESRKTFPICHLQSGWVYWALASRVFGIGSCEASATRTAIGVECFLTYYKLGVYS